MVALSAIAVLGFAGAVAGVTASLSPGLVGILARLGSLTMPIYLAHIVALAAARIGLTKLGIGDLTTHIVVGTLVGILLPLLLYAVSVRTGAERLLGFGATPRPVYSTPRQGRPA